jgi:pimeloyl-ACP methyl ester carboxylesterase
MSTRLPPPARAGSVTSADGTTIGYRLTGHGPAIVLLHGGGQSSQNFMTLAGALGDRHTVCVPDRRGRGMSGPCREHHGIQAEVQDLAAVLRETGARGVFGLSAGAVIALEAARSLPGSIDKLALYEPPLEFDGVTQTSWLARYERELEAGRLAAALVTVMKGTADRTTLRLVPRFLLVAALGLAIGATRGRPAPPGVVSPRDLIPTIHYDARTVREAAGPPDRFAGLDRDCEVLLLGGARSARSLTAALDRLSAVLPGARRATLPGVGHTAADNGGRPELVAAELRAFFG